MLKKILFKLFLVSEWARIMYFTDGVTATSFGGNINIVVKIMYSGIGLFAFES